MPDSFDLRYDVVVVHRDVRRRLVAAEQPADASAIGAGDSREEALAYMEATIGESGRASTRERKEAFVDGVEDFVDHRRARAEVGPGRRGLRRLLPRAAGREDRPRDRGRAAST